MRRLCVEGCNKPARPPALQVRPSRVQANHIIITSTIGGPAALQARPSRVQANRIIITSTIGGPPAPDPSDLTPHAHPIDHDTSSRVHYTFNMLEILPQLLFNSLITGSIYALASAGLALTFGLTRILNFAHGHIMMVGAYAFFFLRVQQELPLAPAVCAAALLMALVGSVSLAIFVMPFANVSPLLPFVTTIALGSILEAIVSITFGVNVRSFPTGVGAESIEWHGIFMTPTQLIIITSALCIFTVMGTVVHASPIGRKVRALGENRAAAEGLGISHRSMLYGIFIISTLLAGYAGVLVGYETNVQPTMGGTYSIKAFAAMILGGLGNVWGTVIGSFLLGFIENLSIGLDLGEYSLPAGYKDAFAFIIILGVLLVRPQGIFGSKARKT